MQVFKHLNAEYGMSLEEFGRTTVLQIKALVTPMHGSHLAPMTQKQRRELAREIRREHGLQDS